MTRSVRGLALALAFCVPPCAAQTQTAPGPVLTLRQAVSEALLRHPARVRAGHEVAAAGYQRDAAEWGRFPTLSVDAAPRVSGGQNNTAPTTTMRLDQPLWAGGRIDAAIDQARSQVSAAESAEGETRQRLSERASIAYLGWVDALERVEIARAGAEVLAGLVRYVRRRESEGVASSADVAIASARYANVLAASTALRGALERARAELESVTLLTGFDRGVRVDVPPYIAGAEQVERDYAGASPLLEQRRAELEAARAQVRVREGQMWPRLSLRLERLSGGAAAFGSNESRAMVVMQFQPEPGLASYSGFQSAGSRAEAAAAQLAADENETRLRARAHFAEYAAARDQAADLDPQVRSLETAAASFMRQFEAGRKSWLEVLNTHRETIDAQLAFSQARTARDQAALRLMANVGALTTWLETLPR